MLHIIRFASTSTPRKRSADERSDVADLLFLSEATSAICFSFRPGVFDPAYRCAHAGYLLGPALRQAMFGRM
jgi:hypothetical protein